MSGARTRHQAIVAPPGLSSSADIRARPTQLPIVSDSIDAVLLPHILEFATDPYAIVREADRVLVGEGRLLVLGFRPWSLWGLARALEPQRLSAGHAAALLSEAKDPRMAALLLGL